MAEQSQLEPKYGAVQAPALALLGAPERFRECVAVILDKGGDNGYWMRILGNENYHFRRAGALVITPDAVCYSEKCAVMPKPTSTTSRLKFLAGGKERAFGDFLWLAEKEDIEELVVHPICHSAHGAYAAVEITALGRHIHLGLGFGRPHVQDCVAALRHLAGTGHPLHERSAGEPRTDGAYVFAANSRSHRFQGWVFDGSTAALLGMNDVSRNLDDLRSGSWKVTQNRYRAEGDHYVIDNEDPDLRREVFVQPDGRLVFQAAMHRGKPDEYGERTSEFEFVRNSNLTERWGLPTIAGSPPAAVWPPVLTRSKDIEAPDIGATKARVKG